MRDFKQIKKELLKERQNRCSVCGKVFSVNELQVEHIIPVRLGGSNDIDNLRLVCSHCNAQKADHIFTGSEIEKYVFMCLNNNENFRNIGRAKSNGKYTPDIVAERKNGNKWEKIFIEVKGVPTLSQDRISYISEQLTEMQKAGNGQPVLAITGRLAEPARLFLQNKKIEVWDEDFLASIFHSVNGTDNNNPDSEIINPVPIQMEEQELINRLKNCEAGKKEWVVYQKLVGEILERLFCPPLSKLISEKEDAFGFNRRDFILPNYCESGFWSFMRNVYHADFIVIDAKNHSDKIMKKDVLQMSNYLKEHGTGLFGLIICRKGATESADYKVRETWMAERKLILVLDDNDIEQMLIEKGSGRQPELVLRQKIEDFRLSM